MYAFVALILKFGHTYRQDGREMTFYRTNQLSLLNIISICVFPHSTMSERVWEPILDPEGKTYYAHINTDEVSIV